VPVPVHLIGGLAVRRAEDYKGVTDIRKARGGAAEKPRPPRSELRARTLRHPRAARRGRLVVRGLRYGTPDAEAR